MMKSLSFPQFSAVLDHKEMSYFTDKAFSSSFLSKSKGLSDMIVKKEDDDDMKFTRASSVFSPKYDIPEDRGFDSFRAGSSRTNHQPAPRRDYLSSTLLESRSYDRPSESRYLPTPSASTSYSRSRATSQHSDNLLQNKGNSTKVHLPSTIETRETRMPERRSRYSTVLVRAKSEMRANDEDDLSLPVDIFWAQGSSRKREKKRVDNIIKQREDSEPVYFSDRHFANNFLNNNPKLQDMLQKVEK